MPLAIRTVRRRVGSTNGFDPDAAAYVRAVQDADGAALEPAVAFAINNFVLGCKADGVWTAIKSSCILMGARTLAGALTPLVGDPPTNNGPFVSGDYSRKNGLLGNTTSKNLDTGRALNADPQNDVHCAVYVHTVTSSANSYYIGANSASNAGAVGLLLAGIPATGTHSTRGRNGGARVAGALLTGLFGLSRASSAAYSTINGGVTGTQTQASSAPGSETMRVFANNNAGTVQSFSNSRIQFYSVGTSLSLSLLSGRLVDLEDAIGAAIP